MPQLAATDTVAIQLEAVSPELPLLAEKEAQLDSRIQDAGKAEMVSTRNFRIPMQVALPGAVAKVNLDGGDFPRGGKGKYDVGTVTPIAYCVPLEFTQLAKMTGSGGNVSTIDVVARNIAQCIDALKNNRDKFLQTDGTGKLATVKSDYAGAGANPITLSATPFGARLLAIGQKVQVFNGNALRNPCTITDIGNSLGGSQAITVDAVPAGTVAGDFIRVDGVENGGPLFLNGIPVFHSTSTAGNVLGIARTNSYVVAQGVNAASASLTQPMIRLAKNQIRQKLGDAAVKGLVFHTHPSQLDSYEQLGFTLQTIPLQGGNAGGGTLDLMFSGQRKMDGHEVIENIHADQTRIDLLNFDVWGKVKWGDGTFWYEVEGNRMWPIPAAAGGGWSSGVITFLVDCLQYYANNMVGLGSISSLAVPAGN
jgi:hypothetical protein